MRAYFFSKCATSPLYAVVTRIDSSVAAFCFDGFPACMSGWYLRISWRYDVLIAAMSAPTSRSSTLYHSVTCGSLRAERGMLGPLLDELELLPLCELHEPPPFAACSFMRRNASSAAAFWRA